MYDPVVGKFLSEDPIGFDGGDTNLTRYVGNGPTNATDPSGLVLVAFDGTDNSLEKPTNVAHFAKEYDGNVLYVSGVGTQESGLAALRASGMGHGTEERLKAMYQALEQHLRDNPRDRSIDITGFSRGAASARHFANMIQPLLKEHGANIRFVGVFDTVPSMGPTLGDGGLSLERPGGVGKAVHAMSIHEDRAQFGLKRYPKATEVWFPGVHADVGGGYPAHESGFANAAFRWMMQEAVSAGVPIKETYHPQHYPSLPSMNVMHDQIKDNGTMWTLNAGSSRRTPRKMRPDDYVHVSAAGVGMGLYQPMYVGGNDAGGLLDLAPVRMPSSVGTTADRFPMYGKEFETRVATTFTDMFGPSRRMVDRDQWFPFVAATSSGAARFTQVSGPSRTPDYVERRYLDLITVHAAGPGIPRPPVHDPYSLHEFFRQPSRLDSRGVLDALRRP